MFSVDIYCPDAIKEAAQSAQQQWQDSFFIFLSACLLLPYCWVNASFKVSAQLLKVMQGLRHGNMKVIVPIIHLSLLKHKAH